MKKFMFLMGVVLMTAGISISNASPPNDSCSITCYEKTPTCYVTKDKSGCLDISNEKPVCTDKSSCVCSLKGCDKKTTY